MKTIIFLILSFASINLWASPQTIENFRSHPLLLKSKNKSFMKAENCRSRIQSLMCLVDSPSDDPAGTDRPCLPGGEDYSGVFESLYDRYPEVLKKVFCSLDVIYIEKNFTGTAYAGTSPNSSKVVLGVRRSVIDENLSLHQWASWKEQLSFGGLTDSYTSLLHLPMIKTETAVPGNDFLYFVIAHEFAHILDFANKVNDTVADCPVATEENPDPECAMKEGSWGAIGWLTNQTPKPENEVPYRTGICFYWCGSNPLDISKVLPIYDQLYYKTDFISIYATTQPWDDFADSLAYTLIHQNLESTYVIESSQGTTYDIIAKLQSPIFNKKYRFINDFINRKDIVYP